MSSQTMVYKTGSQLKVDGDFFDYRIVEADPPEGAEEEQSELAKALQEGWFLTTAQALEGTPPDDVEPTREELVSKATELGLKFAKAMTTKKLAELVSDAQEG